MYPLNLTTYTEKDLETICDRKYRRKPFKYFPSKKILSLSGEYGNTLIFETINRKFNSEY